MSPILDCCVKPEQAKSYLSLREINLLDITSLKL
jgi:hypothetical protein